MDSEQENRSFHIVCRPTSIHLNESMHNSPPMNAEEIPRAVLIGQTNLSYPPTTLNSDILRERNNYLKLIRGSKWEELCENWLFVQSIDDMISGKQRVTDQTLGAAFIISHYTSIFDRWLAEAIRSVVWRQPDPLSRLSILLIERECQRVLLLWLKRLNLCSAEVENAVWSVFKSVMMKRGEMRRYDVHIILACVIFACAKLLDMERPFAQIIKTSEYDEKSFLNVEEYHSDNPRESGEMEHLRGKRGNVLHFYNQVFLPKARRQIEEGKLGRNPFPSTNYYLNESHSLTPFVTFRISPFKSKLRRASVSESSSRMFIFKPWHQL